MRVCVFSNSHAAALQLGLQAVPANWSVTIAAARSNGLKDLKANGQRLCSTKPDLLRQICHTTGGDGDVNPDSYDFLILHALGFRYYYEALDFGLPSRQFFCEYFKLRWRQQSVAARLIEEIRKITDKPIVLSPQPYISGNAPIVNSIAGHLPQSIPSMAELTASFETSDYGDVMIMDQPAETVVNHIFTEPSFSRGSKRLSVGDAQSGKEHPEDDYEHMNGDYGALFWRDVSTLLSVSRRTGSLVP